MATTSVTAMNRIAGFWKGLRIFGTVVVIPLYIAGAIALTVTVSAGVNVSQDIRPVLFGLAAVVFFLAQLAAEDAVSDRATIVFQPALAELLERILSRFDRDPKKFASPLERARVARDLSRLAKGAWIGLGREPQGRVLRAGLTHLAARVRIGAGGSWERQRGVFEGLLTCARAGTLGSSWCLAGLPVEEPGISRLARRVARLAAGVCKAALPALLSTALSALIRRLEKR